MCTKKNAYDHVCSYLSCISKNWKQSKCPSTEKQLCYIHRLENSKMKQNKLDEMEE